MNKLLKASYHDVASWSKEHQEEFFNNLYLEVGDTYGLQLNNPFDINLPLDRAADEFVKVSMDRDYLSVPVKHILNMDLFPYQYVALDMLWNYKLPMLIASRGGAKTMMLAVYIILRAMLDQGIRIVVCGGGMRQAALVMDKITEIWDNAPVLRDICGGADRSPKRGIDAYYWKIGRSTVIAIPIGTGNKIRGLRANVIAADEFGSLNAEIFEMVIRGFAAVQSKDTVEAVKEAYRKQYLKELNLDDLEEENDASLSNIEGNQIIISGTATYQFNHFYKYFERYCDIIRNRGVVEGQDTKVKYKDYAVVRVPYQHLPLGMMDEAVLDQGRAIMDSSIFDMEYNCVFPKDSEGFFPASVVYGSIAPIKIYGQEVKFTVELEGEEGYEYVMGIDPASERDNLVISIVKLFNTHRQHVYTWSANRKSFEKDKKKFASLYSQKKINDYNTFIIYKIYDLMSRFNIVRIHLDSGGGGHSIVEGCKDSNKIPGGANPIFDMDDEEVLGEKGLHIIKRIEFVKREWYENAHYNLLKDLTSKSHVFPYYDSIAIEQDLLENRKGTLLDDTIEFILSNVEEVKYQTTLIQEQTTPKGHKKWDLPKLHGVLTSDIKAKLRRDHFTSLLLVNDAARDYLKPEEEQYQSGRGRPKGSGKKIENAEFYSGKGAAKMRRSGYNPTYSVRSISRDR